MDLGVLAVFHKTFTVYLRHCSLVDISVFSIHKGSVDKTK